MSYARWSHSAWYAYHSACSGKALEEQILMVDHITQDYVEWSYADLKKEVMDLLVAHDIPAPAWWSKR